MADQTIEKCSSEVGDDEKKQRIKKNVTEDPETFSCMLQPCPANSDPNYVGIRRLLLFGKAESGVLRRKDWRCNGKGYVAYRNFINRPDNWINSQIPSRGSTPGASGRWIHSPSQLSLALEMESLNGSKDLRESQTLSRTVSFGANSSDFEYPRRKAEPAYSFVGMHCIFDECKAMVTVIKFGHMSSDILAYGATDGTLTVCTVSEPPSVMKKLTGHSKDVTDFDFTLNNQYIASSSLDKTVRVWDIPKGLCIRVIYGVASQLCIRFHPVNNNFLSVGNANREASVFNFSTGRLISKIVVDSEITALDYDHTGQFIFCGDTQGSIYTVKVNSHQDGSLSFFSVSLEMQGYLTLRCSLQLAPRLHSIRASFCPLLSLEKGEYIVIGSEDATVYFYDLTRLKNTCVNKLQGHGYPVIAVAWNHGENLLASSDFGGTVIVWKREKTKQKM
ncbi:WD repeat-containing protein 13-like isoform X2 [Cynara cardunculus var. scolymus]|uniref:WD repeat-containing protein 13-like isoform X2 n=1 Tax=Cynara cardunculus var. scolymus TaxID=59895 RepID=UPI000D625A20|nr:WD repeat-containing protein 13-like isoform X2 [Cynara cardunculus var. scolymus]